MKKENIKIRCINCDSEVLLGNLNEKKSCPKCGSNKGYGVMLYICSNCGYEYLLQEVDLNNKEMECPECGSNDFRIGIRGLHRKEGIEKLKEDIPMEDGN